MKKRAALMAGILVLHTLGASLAMANREVGLTERQQQLMQIMEEKGAKQAIREMSDEELRSVRDDLRAIITTLSEDFAIAELQDGEKLGYKVRTVGLYGVGTAATIFLLGLLDETYGTGRRAGPDGGGSIMAGFILSVIVGSVSVLATTTGQVVVWLTPSEANKVKDRLEIMVKALNHLESRLK